MKKDKKELNKIGRPKLADKDLKVNSYIMCLMGLVLVMCLMIGGVFSLTSVGSNELLGSSNKVGYAKFCSQKKNKGCCEVWITDNRFYQATFNWKCNNASIQRIYAKLASKSGNGSELNVDNKNTAGSYRVDKLLNAEKSLTANTKYKVGIKIDGSKHYTEFTTPSTSAYAIVFRANGGTGTMSDQQVTYGKSTAIRNNAYSKSGYTFKGWNAYRPYQDTWYGYNKNNQLGWYKKSNIKTYYVYKNKEKVAKTAPIGKVVEMRAVWEAVAKKTYTLTFKPNGGTGTMSNQTITYNVGTAIKTNTFTRKYYTFNGWKAYRQSDQKWYGYNKNNTQGWYKKTEIKKYYIYKDKTVVSKTSSINGDIVEMWADWVVRNTVTLGKVKSTYFDFSWSTKGCIKSFRILNSNADSGQGTEITSHTPSKCNDSWGIGKEGSLEGSAKNKILPDSYYLISVKFDDGQVINKLVQTTKATTTTKANANSQNTNSGSTASCSGKAKNNCSGKTSGYYNCIWKQNACYNGTAVNYLVKYDSNGGTGTMSNQYIKFGGSTALSSNKFTRSGYKFIGWKAWRSQDDKWYGYDKNNKLGWYKTADIVNYYHYANGTKVGKTTKAGTYAIMYAVWQSNTIITKANANNNKNTYTIKYNAGKDATGTMDDQVVTVGSSVTLRDNKYTNTGYTLCGWAVTKTQEDIIFWYGYDKNNKLGWYTAKQLKNWHYKGGDDYYTDRALYVLQDREKVNLQVNAGETIELRAYWSQNVDYKLSANSTKFNVVSSAVNCYTIQAPKDAKYWRIAVYYKSASASTYGNNKYISRNHYNDGKTTDTICFTRRKYNEETHRILVKKTTGANDKLFGSVKDWMPSGFKANNNIGWAYKDYTRNW